MGNDWFTMQVQQTQANFTGGDLAAILAPVTKFELRVRIRRTRQRAADDNSRAMMILGFAGVRYMTYRPVQDHSAYYGLITRQPRSDAFGVPT
jgi:hypothetical protein